MQDSSTVVYFVGVVGEGRIGVRDNLSLIPLVFILKGTYIQRVSPMPRPDDEVLYLETELKVVNGMKLLGGVRREQYNLYTAKGQAVEALNDSDIFLI